MKVTTKGSQALAERGMRTTADLKKTLLAAIRDTVAGKITPKECNAIGKSAGQLIETGLEGVKQMHPTPRRKAAAK